ncbi:hypothetical protein HOU02_gp476 [Caulobacter phage CcrBL9]|uniref:Uncharacterized protein n=1 Tax=Caulobacter phage CcrBL9 TaxID=2283270 RepID=A0A385EEX6_9CAUD|nr:hypothetical protein HOU02_gp476 [Caulobacter phage CcrBL9]AXQ69249.1 hypothetical protein CcrBL9_gp225 [Caulobacter phage CcrBL9]
MGYDYAYSGTITITPEVSMKKAKEVNRYKDGHNDRYAPQQWCGLEINEDGELEYTAGEGQCEVAAWIGYFLDGPLKGYTLNGTITETCGDFQSQTDIEVENNVIYTIDYEMQPGPRVRYPPEPV